MMGAAEKLPLLGGGEGEKEGRGRREQRGRDGSKVLGSSLFFSPHVLHGRPAVTGLFSVWKAAAPSGGQPVCLRLI